MVERGNRSARLAAWLPEHLAQWEKNVSLACAIPSSRGAVAASIRLTPGTVRRCPAIWPLQAFEVRRGRLAVRAAARRERLAVDLALGLRALFAVTTTFCGLSGDPSFSACRRARFQSLRASDAYLRARLASRFASFKRLRALRSSSFASRTRCWATSACSRARSMISADSAFSAGESSAEGNSLPVFLMACLRSEPPVSHKPQALATAHCGRVSGPVS
jgi:hypothetical protein